MIFRWFVWIFIFFVAPLQADADKNTLKSGWYDWDPYQYLRIPGETSTLTGMDIELQKLIFKKLGYNVDISLVSWKQHQEDLRSGERDIALGAFYSKEREQHSFISIPYRFEENSFFSLRNNAHFRFMGDNVHDFLEIIKRKKMKIGVIESYLYADDLINKFINDPLNAELIQKSQTDNQNLALLLAGKIDGFLSDRIVGATIIWREKVGSKISEHRLNAKAPIHMLLSRKSFNEERANDINHMIQQVKESAEYTQIVSWYIYPVLLLETTDSLWFEIIHDIGIIAFALSGLVLAYRHNTSFFGTFILALLPSFGGGVLRDAMFGRFPIWFLSAKSYMFLLLFVVIIGFFSIKMARYYINRRSDKLHHVSTYKTTEIFDALITITDALGLAAFTVTGIVVCLIIKAEPLWLWGPFFAFLTGAGGGILRDLLIKESKVEVLHGSPYAEITIFWGAFLSLCLTYTTYDVDPFKIKLSVIITIILVFLTRLFIYFFNIPNLYFWKK